MIKSANKAALETAQRKYMEKKAVFTPGAHMLVAHNQYRESRAPKPAPAAPAPVSATTPEYIKSLEMLQTQMEDPSWKYPTSPTPGWDIWGDVNFDRDSLGNIVMDVGDYGLTSGWISPDASFKRTTTPILSRPDASENIQPATGLSELDAYALGDDDIRPATGPDLAFLELDAYTLGDDDIRSVVGPAPAPATEVKSEPAPAAPVTPAQAPRSDASATAQRGNAMMRSMYGVDPVPAPRSDASATAQQGNDMMRGLHLTGSPNRASMYGVDPVPVPVFDPSKITRNDMRKYRRYTAANDMNSEMDKWKTWMAMQGYRNVSNADYRRAKANGFRM